MKRTWLGNQRTHKTFVSWAKEKPRLGAFLLLPALEHCVSESCNDSFVAGIRWSGFEAVVIDGFVGRYLRDRPRCVRVFQYVANLDIAGCNVIE